MKIDKKCAITFGRFNYFSKGHAYFFEEILTKWDNLVIMCLENSDIRRQIIPTNDLLLNSFYKECDKNFTKKLLPVAIRMEALNYFAKKYPNRITIISGERPENFPSRFNMDFPANKFDLVFSKDYSNYFDLLRCEAFEKILDREVTVVHPRRYIHNSEIALLSNKEEKFWPEVWDYYQKEGILI
ncbi:hypothetical protein ACERC8_09475 [Streptococcus sp. E29BA]|uniref:hypothetical protein n=1 Tax=Streptococcus sp. E29BA TaxID=3278716 RepID=UPI00359D951A